MWWLRRKPAAYAPDAVQSYYAAPTLNQRQSWRETPFAVIDVETTGLDVRHDSLLSVGVVWINHARIDLASCWETLIQPPSGAPRSSAATSVHGILPTDIAEAPPAAEALANLLTKLTGRVLIVHVATIDIGFINRALQHHFQIPLRGPGLDTAQLARILQLDSPMGVAPQIALRTLCEAANLPIYAEHRALSDAVTTAQLFLYQATKLEQQGAHTVHDLYRLGGCLR